MTYRNHTTVSSLYEELRTVLADRYAKVSSRRQPLDFFARLNCLVIDVTDLTSAFSCSDLHISAKDLISAYRFLGLVRSDERNERRRADCIVFASLLAAITGERDAGDPRAVIEVWRHIVGGGVGSPMIHADYKRELSELENMVSAEDIRAALDVVVVDQTWGIAVKERDPEGLECVLFAAWAGHYGWHESPDESLEMAVRYLAEQGWRPSDGPVAALAAFARAEELHPPTNLAAKRSPP